MKEAKPSTPMWGGAPDRLFLVWLWGGLWRTHQSGSVPRVYTERSDRPCLGDLELVFNEAELYWGRGPGIHNTGIDTCTVGNLKRYEYQARDVSATAPLMMTRIGWLGLIGLIDLRSLYVVGAYVTWYYVLRIDCIIYQYTKQSRFGKLRCYGRLENDFFLFCLASYFSYFLLPNPGM